jgi:hypothetical protein
MDTLLWRSTNSVRIVKEKFRLDFNLFIYYTACTKCNYRRTPLSTIATANAVSLDAEGEVSLSVVKMGRDKVMRVDRYCSPGLGTEQLGSWASWISTACSDNERIIQLGLFGWGETEFAWYVGHSLTYCTSPEWWWVWSSRWIKIDKRNWSIRRKFASVPLSTTNPTWTDLGSNPGHRGGTPATNRLSYGTAILDRWQNLNTQ